MTNIPRETSYNINIKENDFTFKTTWGLFSPKELDEGAKLIIENIRELKDEDILDIGCGYGPIGIILAKIYPEINVDMVDKDMVAIEYAIKNSKLNGVKNIKSFLSNTFSNIPADKRYDIIVSNLPAKAGKEFLTLLFEDAKRYLKTGGIMYLSTINGIRKYVQRLLEEEYGNYEKIEQGRGHTVGLVNYLTVL